MRGGAGPGRDLAAGAATGSGFNGNLAREHPGRIMTMSTAREPKAGDRKRSFGEHDENGVDVSLLRYLLQLSPLERLRLMEQHARDSEALREHGRRHRETRPPENR